MELDDELCLCFHVTKRKVVNHIRIHKPVKASQLSECFGAGTGCGWCRPFLQRLLEQSTQQIEHPDDGLPDTTSYASGRQQHRKNKGLT
ncbi:BFD-like [2Fe-2S] binding domain protein [Rosistilla carotiformis]|uniref:BFD-like [2Fe-2S] binding domain protein n=1 Tax=Rosistilla carotiformis TaxID=2528017 RepID=A0A518K1A1_9BACT|nr:(2Fe-2S)-binding protein [Rosistilla carotiformis]QDV71568.1 BFD-like [2Fe-2S] binding domain protein [Rosistilla carotiformis]